MKFDFVVHWIFAILWAILAITGFSMIGARFGWILGYNIVLADYLHRVMAAGFVLITFVTIFYEIIRNLRNNDQKLIWLIFGRSGFQLFTLLTTLMLILSGALLWICMEFDMAAVGFAMLVHEWVSYIALAGVIWHIYRKSHALITRGNDNKMGKTGKIE